MKKIFFLSLIALGLLSFSCTPEWEYKVERVKKNQITYETLNSYGKDGWELVDIYESTIEEEKPRWQYYSSSDSEYAIISNLVFKRKK